MDSLEDSGCWDFLDYSFIDQAPPDFLWSNHSVSAEIDIPGDAVACQENTKKRFCELSSVLEPGRPVRTDKPAILDDAIRVLSQLKTEAQELKNTNEKLLEEIKSLKAEKNELREEKLVLKADKERIEKQLKALPIAPAGFMPPPVAAAYQAGVNKMAVYPNYGYIPMWQYLPQSARDTSHDHELRPPAAYLPTKTTNFA
ncbi:Transcription factor bHLH104 [Mucuna pruriens]|uniref:Transcription factor bHLH104 n=1 Tax=Mucuna pruriens TaxID=157652 RepID=A0A371EVY9_MUCPR|nr:Transcription factor bHLH104 [Mucuna pruriens]